MLRNRLRLVQTVIMKQSLFREYSDDKTKSQVNQQKSLHRSSKDGKSSLLAMKRVFELLNLDITPHIDISKLTGKQIDGLLIHALEEEDHNVIIYLLDNSKLVSRYALERILIDTVKVWSVVDAVHRHILSRDNLDVRWFHTYFAAGLWYKGNLNIAVNEFKTSYHQAETNQERNVVTFLLHTIIIDTVGKKSEATLVILSRLTEYLVCLYDEHGPLMSLWRCAFKSEWWSDQQISKELFEKHPTLRQMLSTKAGALCYSYLADEDADACQRLLQLFLQFDDRVASRTVLVILFDYHYLRRDLRSCSEIVQFSLKVDIQMDQECSKKLMNLLLGGDVLTLVKKKKRTRTPKFTFKF